MRPERLSASGADPAEVAARLRALAPAPESVTETVGEIIADVRARGDEAVRDHARRFGEQEPGPIQGDRRQAPQITGELRRALERAIEHVERVAAGASAQREVRFDSHTVGVREVPVDRAAVYVPGGRAPYPSTVVMGVVPARVAGVREIVVCSPRIDAATLAACRLAGAGEVYRSGGAQAIAALAYGTETVRAVDVIVGPGNLYVQEAKRLLSSRVGIDGFAGPSDLVVIADADASPAPLALDLIAQAEHGLGTVVVAISPGRELLDALTQALIDAPETGAAAALVEVSDAEQALAIAEAFAPEHLQLAGASAEALAARVTRAGCVFIGAESGTAFGDYIAGSNHILPTNGAARFASALSPAHFRRTIPTVHIRDARELARTAAPLARAEGFEYHARSMEARIRDNHPQR